MTPSTPRSGPADARRPVVAAFVSSHGFGHAARATAVLAALRSRIPEVRIELFGATPSWFFATSFGQPGPSWHQHPDPVDLGLVQSSALEEDLQASVRALESWAPPPEARVDEAARKLAELGVDAVLCDISPLGLAAARRADLPCLLVESFTWSWIYDGYREISPELAVLGDRLAPLFESATVRLQTEPCCGRRGDLPVVGPISRPCQEDRETVRARLGLEDDLPMVLVTMGGIEWNFEETAAGLDVDAWIVQVGGTDRFEHRGRVVHLPHRTPIHHPDLVGAADAVIAKLGYSTLAESWRSGLPVGYVPRPLFPESPILEAWVKETLPHCRVDPTELADGSWRSVIPKLVTLSKRPPEVDPDGPAKEAAKILAGWLPCQRTDGSDTLS